MDYKKIKKDLRELSLIDDRGLICHSYANCSTSQNYVIYMKIKSIRQDHLPSFMILSINDDLLHISKAGATGVFKEYIGSLDLHRLTYLNSFNKDGFSTYEFAYDLENGIRIPFYINTTFLFKDKVSIFLEEIIEFNKNNPLNIKYGYSEKCDDWYNEKYEYLIELSAKNELYKLAEHIRVYFVLKTLFNNGLKSIILNKSFIKYDEAIKCAKILDNQSLIYLLEKVGEIYNKVGKINPELSKEEELKLDKYSSDFDKLSQEIDIFQKLEKYYKQNYLMNYENGNLMLVEMFTKQVCSNVCEHISPILTNEIENNNRIYRIDQSNDYDTYTVILENKISNYYDNVDSNVLYSENVDSNDIFHNKYTCKKCRCTIASLEDNSVFLNEKYKNKVSFKYILLMGLGLLLSIVGCSIIALLMFAMFSAPEDNFSSSSFKNFMTFGVIFGIGFYIYIISKIKKPK